MLLGELPKKTRPHQELPVETRTGLPPTMQDGTYVLFLRWAPGDTPDFHHHMLVATDEVVETIDAMVQHARADGQLGTSAEKRRARVEWLRQPA